MEAWSDTLATTLRMESLAVRLLELARVEDPARVVHLQTVPLAGAIEEAWQPWAAGAAERAINLITELPPGLVIVSDPTLLGVILGNLCANAARHAPAASPLLVTTTTGAGENITLHFKNRAGDLTAADLPQLFERFWRKDSSRTDARHHGLGLALAAEFATLLGGNLTAQIAPDGELDFALELPQFGGSNLRIR